jgi:hypothetical protein
MTDTFRTDTAIEHLNEEIENGGYPESIIKDIKAKKMRILKKQNEGFDLVVFNDDCFKESDLVFTRISGYEKEN